MKRTVILMAMALMVSVAFAQTADKLIKKYKGMKGMQYENVTKQIQNMKKDDDPKMYEASRGLTTVEYLSGVMSESKAEKLQEELDALEGFKRVYHEKHNSNDGPLSMLRGQFKLFYNVQYYAVEDGENFKEVVARIDADASVGNLVTLIHLKGQMKQEDVAEFIQIEEDTDMTLESE